MSQTFIRTLCEAMSEPGRWETKNIFKKLGNLSEDKATQLVVKAMMCENTGRHLLDSGDAYGRRFERNQSIQDQDWEKIRKRIRIEVWNDEFTIYKDIYHFLTETLIYDPEMDEKFQKFMEESENSHFQDMKDFGEVLDTEAYTENSYNSDNCLGGTIQFTAYIFNNANFEAEYIAIQTHNGCDARGGYSTPHIFRFTDDLSHFEYMIRDINAECPNYAEKQKTTQIDLNGKKVRNGHTHCYSDDAGYSWNTDCDGYGSINEFLVDNENEKVLCPKCKTEIEFN